MNTTPYWISTCAIREFPSLERDIEVDVAVIGGGITGATAAYLLKKAGKKVALIEREKCARVDSGHTTAHLTCVTDTRLHTLVKKIGEDHAKAVWDAGYAAIDQIRTNIFDEDIECDFRWIPGFLHGPLDAKSKSNVDDFRSDADLAVKFGFDARFVDEVPLVKRPGVRFRNQALFHPRKYIGVLLETIPGGGSHVLENSAAEEVEEKPLAIKVGKHKIKCEYLVIATHTPLMGKTGLVSATLFQSKLFLYTSYALGARIPKGVGEGSFWSTDEPYYYLRINEREHENYAIFGGEDHKTGQETNTEERFAALQSKFAELFPVGVTGHHWSGQVIETPDGIPYIGEAAEGQFVATGFSGNGMTFGTLAGMMARDAVLGRKNPWKDLFAVNRKKISGTWNYIKENADYPYYMVRDRLAKAEGESLEDLKPGEGKILKLKGKKIAAYRGMDKKVTKCSPVCTHLGCIVAWNDAEKTWDCPCHGSRFKPTGEVLSGPAEAPLESV